MLDQLVDDATSGYPETRTDICFLARRFALACFYFQDVLSVYSLVSLGNINGPSENLGDAMNHNSCDSLSHNSIDLGHTMSACHWHFKFLGRRRSENPSVPQSETAEVIFVRPPARRGAHETCFVSWS